MKSGFQIAFLAPLLYCACLNAQSSGPAEQAEQLYNDGERAIAENRLEAASQAYLKLVRLNPKVAETHAKLGLIYYMGNRYADAIPELRSALQLKPALANVDVLLSICYAEQARYDQALPGLERGFMTPPDPNLKRLIGLELARTHIALKQLDRAAQGAIELSRLFPNDPEVLYNAGHILGDLAYSSMKHL